jgi:uncharacterized protein (TIGR02391 family)
MMTMKGAFPTAQLLVEAPIFDVAGIMLEIMASRPANEWQHAQNLVPGWAQEYGRESSLVIRPLSEAWIWLENNGFIADELLQGVGTPGKFVTRAGLAVKSRSDFLAYAQDSLLPREMLRGDLAEIVRPLFLSGHFDQAVSAAFKALEVYVRNAGGLGDDFVGVKLMRAAFHPETGSLTHRESEGGERQGLSDLFAGAMAVYRNPFAHRNVGISHAVQAASLILVANELLALAHAHAQLREDGATNDASTVAQKWDY